jgi:predicted nucleic acid-binding protein
VKALLDTSVLLAALIEEHQRHDRAFPKLLAARNREYECFVSQHSLAELYCNLTRLPYEPRITPAGARDAIRRDITTLAQIVALLPADYDAVIERMAALGLTGATIYDALIARAAEKAGVDRLYTLNPADFRRVWPEGDKVISEP